MDLGGFSRDRIRGFVPTSSASAVYSASKLSTNEAVEYFSGTSPTSKISSDEDWDIAMFAHLSGVYFPAVANADSTESTNNYNFRGTPTLPIFPGPRWDLISGKGPKDFPIQYLPLSHAMRHAYAHRDSGGSIDYSNHTFDRRVRMYEYSIAAFSHIVDTLPEVDEQNAVHRNIRFGGKNIFISSHILDGGNWSDPELGYMVLSTNTPTSNDLFKISRDVPISFNGDDAPQYPQVRTLIDKINTITPDDGNIYIATDNDVFRITSGSLARNNSPVVRRIMTRGINTEMASESTSLFGAQDNQVISFRYYEEARKYSGYNETKDFTPLNISQVVTMTQNHNIALCVAGYTDRIYILSLGSQRAINGFSEQTFHDNINKIIKLDHNRVLILFQNSAPGIWDFSRYNGDFRDTINRDSDMAPVQVNYISKALSLPTINLSEGRGFDQVNNCRINQALISLGNVAGDFTFIIESLGREYLTEVRDILDNRIESVATQPIPKVIKKLPQNVLLAPRVGIIVDGPDNFAFSSIVLDVEDKR